MSRADMAYLMALESCPISLDASIDLFYFWVGIALLYFVYRILPSRK